MFVVIYLTAPIVSNFFAAAQVTNLIRLASIIPLIKGFINPSVVRFQKDLHFGKEFWYRSSLYLADALVAITLGIITHSEYSLVWAMVIGAILEVVLSMAVVKPIPSLRFNSSLAKDIVKEGKWVTLSGIFEYLFQNIDDIAVGRILGATPLGLYQQAYRVSTLTTSEAGEIFNKVTFPVYTKISDDKKILRDAFLKVSLVIGVLVIPFGLILVFWASDVTRILLGNQWLPMVPALQVLAIFGILKALSNSAYSLLLALKKQQAVTFITLIGISGMAFTIIPLVRAFGIVGAGYSAIIGVLLGLPLVLYYLSKSLRP
jgi:O-antigen/teichoic acid export membrane protein